MRFTYREAIAALKRELFEDIEPEVRMSPRDLLTAVVVAVVGNADAIEDLQKLAMNAPTAEDFDGLRRLIDIRTDREP